MNIKNQYLINKLFDCTIESCNLLKMKASQEEIYFIPVGILFMKWINDSKDRFNWIVTNELKNLFVDYEYSHKIFSYGDGSKNIYRMAQELERDNSMLNGIFTSLCFPYIDVVSIDHLESIFRTYNEFEFIDNNAEKAIMGPFIERLLYKLSNDSRFYEFITPKSIRQLLAKMFKLKEYMYIADVACGTGGILSEVVNEYQSNDLYTDRVKLYGQDINSKVVLIAKLNMLLHGITNSNIVIKDTLKDPILYRNNELNSFDIVLSNLPLGVNWNISETGYSGDFKYGVPSSKMHADWIFIQRGIASLKAVGIAAFIVSKGTLTRNSELDIRKRILNDDIIDAVISLPSNLYGSKTMPIEILVINKDKASFKKDKILFIDASKKFYKEERGRNALTIGDIDKILQIYHGWIEIDEYSKVIDNSIIDLQGFQLDSSLYINRNQLLIKHEKMCKLKEISDVRRGFQLPKDDGNKLSNSQEESHYYIKISDIVDGKIEFREKIKGIPYNKIITYELKPGDIIISARGTLIKTAIYKIQDPPSIISGNIMLIRIKTNYNPYFLKFYLDSYEGQEQIQTMQSGATITSLNHSKLQELFVPNIDFEKQNRLADRITENEREYKLKIEHAENIYDQQIDIINKEIFDFIGE
ncbi:N-6 DNA methylase [Clostridium estertheticum]|uniref:N-6 DNA methylase n=1 Tax=Clostridium estertheticum TaxID=238834 RepID=UPI001C6E7097|nr:N-6 DNA methylase [Clostridium estertheticum]MBW9154322.1 N-6 DNA methylase [Clostridium estertheticum]WLC86637.1 N-6 DNA methylase [Clostridium estertheticum]